MKEYVCSICGYIHKGDLPDDFVCPICGAGKDAFILKENATKKAKTIEKTHFEKELTPIEISIICSNLARGCEKQYMPKEAETFSELANFFNSASQKETDGDVDELMKKVELDLESGFVYANQEAEKFNDRGAKRALLWSQKVTNMLKSILTRYKAEGEKMLENTGVYVCTICGFIHIGNEPPERCPVCKVPAFKFEKIEEAN